MLVEVIAVAGLAALCASWVVVQRWFSKHDPGAPGVEGPCAGCGSSRCVRGVNGGNSRLGTQHAGSPARR
jgi:hypothetical protein